MSLPLNINEKNNMKILQGLISLLSNTEGLRFFVWSIDGGGDYISSIVGEKFVFPSKSFAEEPQMWENVFYKDDRRALKEKILSLHRGVQEIEQDCRVLTLKNTYEWVNLRCRAVPGNDGKLAFITGIISEIEMVPRTDATTGLLTQARFNVDLKNHFEKCDKKESGVLLLFGIDDFKAVNGRHGNHLGNKVLQAFAKAFEKELGKAGRVYRMDGDCFAVLLREKNRFAAEKLYTKVSYSLQEACKALEKNMFITISAGASVYPQDTNEPAKLYQFAENALNNAKNKGKDRLEFFSIDKYEQYLHNITLSEDLRACVQNNFANFEIYFQPLVRTESGRVKGAEALLRWDSQSHGRVSPIVFIPLLEKMGLICEVGRWVIDKALEKCAQWRELSPGFCININLSYIQLKRDDIAGYLLNSLRYHNLTGEAVVLEITESEQLANFNYYNETLGLLNQLGATVAIDDFGTGYSSLEYLKELKIDQIKIDRCFVRRISKSSYDYNLIQFIINMAHSANLDVCVEGVETAEEMAALVSLKPDFIQGFYFGRPVNAEEFEIKYINEWEGTLEALKKAESAKFEFAPQQIEEDLPIIFDGMREYIWVEDLVSGMLLFLNKAACKKINCKDYKTIEYAQMLGENGKPLESYPKGQLCRESYYNWSVYSSAFEGKLNIREKLISWGGRLARVGIAEI